MSGYESLKEAVIRDCNDRGQCGCFNPEGCNRKGTKIGEYGEPGFKMCFHKYCDKFKWAIDRAKEYGEKLGIPWEQILDAWEADRNYWYMNYYQECNQPSISSKNVRVFDTVDDLRASIGDKGFRCPCCGQISTSPYECNSGAVRSDGTVCDWKVYGLLGDLGKGVFVYCKDKVRGERMFMPAAWEPDAIKISEEEKFEAE